MKAIIETQDVMVEAVNRPNMTAVVSEETIIVENVKQIGTVRVVMLKGEKGDSGGGGGGTSDYTDLTNKPSINDVTLSGNKTSSDLGLASANDVSGKLSLSGGTMTGDVAMGGNKVTGLGAGTSDYDACTKKQLDDAIAGLGTVFNIKGDVATVNDLPASGNTVGDVYYVASVSAGYIWLETTDHPTGYWEELGEPIDLSGYIEKPQNPSTGQFLVYNGSAWVAQTVPSANGVSF